MNINGRAIRHKTFGCGVITALTANTITVSFSEGEKKFIYPDAFREHLVLKDKNMQQCITAQIAKKEAEINQQRQAKQAEQERRQKLLNFSIAANSHAIFDIIPEHVEQICKTYIVSTGRYLSGYSKGQPRIADRLKPNSVCLLTERQNRQPEQQRRIIGAFMVREDFFGKDVHDGLIEGHSKYQIRVPSETNLLFWEHFSQNTTPRWGNTAFKYCSGTVMNHILSEMAQMLGNTEQQESALAFYRYFCKINRLRPLMKINMLENTSKEKQ
ncbi:MAG: hypothetical protein E7476_01205 [Ruminococcaceae bacterium]|nr:hypothetical protein [Oscillospiraceae bacterium]